MPINRLIASIPHKKGTLANNVDSDQTLQIQCLK